MKKHKNDSTSEELLKSDQRVSSELDALLKTLREKGISNISALSKEDMIRTANWASRVFNDYELALDRLPFKIMSIADLPFPKEDIKMAIKILLLTFVSEGSDDTVSRLKDRYVRLSAFQDISREDQAILTKESRKLNHQNGSDDRFTLSIYDKYIDLMVAEQNVLVEDINTFIEDLPKRA